MGAIAVPIVSKLHAAGRIDSYRVIVDSDFSVRAVGIH
jgi:hypothetical protein